jgi:hypothetical protein
MVRKAPALAQGPRSRRGSVNTLLPGLYAWVSTVAYPAAHSKAPFSARVAALLALLCLCFGVWMASSRPNVGRRLGLGGFALASAVTWVLLAELMSQTVLDPIRAALGGVAWALFGFGWGNPRRLESVPEDDPRALVDEVLKPRRSLPAGASSIFGAALCLAVLPVFLAWRVDRPDHALMAHAAALASSVAMVTVGAIVAVERGQRHVSPPVRRRVARAASPLAAAVVLALVGLAYRAMDLG